MHESLSSVAARTERVSPGGTRRAVLVLLVGTLVFTAGCVGLEGTSYFDSRNTTASPDEANSGELEVHHIDVGLADATLVITPAGETVLIDTGDEDAAGEPVIAYLETIGIERIDHLVATHAHPEHTGGHAAVIEWAETEGNGVGMAYGPHVSSGSGTHDRYRDALEEYDVESTTVEEGDAIPIEDEPVSAVVLNPPKGATGDEPHHNSVSIVFEYEAFRYLTTGDAEADAEARMLDEWADELDADVYQAGHHGGATSSTRPFMDAVSPAIAVISSDADSAEYPADEVFERFAESDIETYWTGVHGNVVVRTDGSAISVETSEAFSTDPRDLTAEKPSGNGGNSSSISVGSIRADTAHTSD